MKAGNRHRCVARPWLWATAAGLLSCSEATLPQSAAADDGGGLAPDGADGAVQESGAGGAGGEAGSGLASGGAALVDAGGDGVAPPGEAALRILTPAEVLPGVRIPIIVETVDASPFSGTLSMVVGSRAESVTLHRGRGSTSALVGAVEGLRVSARVGELWGEREVVVAARPARHLSGVLAGDDLDWDRRTDIWVSADATVAVGDTLAIGAGTRVLMSAGASLLVAGGLSVSGHEEEPVLFAAAPESGGAWGGVLITGEADIAHAYFVGARGQGPTLGHSASSPVLRIEGGRLTMTGGGVLDNPGKAFGSNDAEVTLDGLVISRCDTGGEFIESTVTLRDSHVLEIPDADGRVDDDDNDGVYLVGVRQTSDAVVRSRVEGCVFSVGEDDGIDQNGAEVDILATFIDGFFHEGIATSSAGEVRIEDCVIRDSDQGVEAGYGSPRVWVRHSTIVGNGVGLRFGDDYEREYTGHLTVSQSLVGGNDQDVRNYSNTLGGPVAGAIEIGCSVVGDATGAVTENDVNRVPEVDRDGCPLTAGTLPQACADSQMGPRTCR